MTSRVLIIGGYGKNIVSGGTSNDILINGYTAYDKSITSLQAILNTWRSKSYSAGVAALRSGAHRLIVGITVFLFPGKSSTGPHFGHGTVLYETNLIGNGGQDWFFTNTLSSVPDRTSSEKVN